MSTILEKIAWVLSHAIQTLTEYKVSHCDCNIALGMVLCTILQGVGPVDIWFLFRANAKYLKEEVEWILIINYYDRGTLSWG